jgi:hypothetical protein
MAPFFEETKNQEEVPMKKLIGAFGLLFLTAGTGTSAQAASWCAYYDISTYNCGFHSYQQCLATIRGAGGWCRPNTYEGGYQERRRRY